MRTRLSIYLAAIAMCALLAASAQAAPVSVGPWDGSYMFYLGTVDANGDDLNDYTGAPGVNGYSTLNFSFTGTTEFGLAYYFLSWDYAGFDEPGFFIEVSDTAPVQFEGAGGLDGLNQSTAGFSNRFEQWASDVDQDGEFSEPQLDSSGAWQQYSLQNLTSTTTYYDTIGAGNTQDGNLQSFAFLDWPMSVPQDVNSFGGPLDNEFPWYYETPLAQGQYGFIEGFESSGVGDFNEVPVPAAFWLLGTGLAGLVGLRRRFSI